MRNKIISALLLLLVVGSNLPANALTNSNEEELIYKGFSPYLVDIVMLQESRHEDNMVIETPDKEKAFWKHIYIGDFIVPTQEFGHYNISPRD